MSALFVFVTSSLTIVYLEELAKIICSLSTWKTQFYINECQGILPTIILVSLIHYFGFYSDTNLDDIANMTCQVSQFFFFQQEHNINLRLYVFTKGSILNMMHIY